MKKDGHSSFDDDISQGALTFLMDLDDTIDAGWLTESIEKGISFFIDSQFENGAWPQWYPLRGGYHDYYTFNDNAINDNIRVLLKIHSRSGNDECLAAAMKGGDFILLSPVSESQPGWAQQYSHDMKPAWARTFEPPAVCSAATVRNIHTLIDLYLYTGEDRYLAPIPAAFEWLERSKIDENLWARMYEVRTNVPIYGDRDSKIHYIYDEISEERKLGYGWRGPFGVAEAKARHGRLMKLGRDGLKKHETSSPDQPFEGKYRDMLSRNAETAISLLDDKGRWIEEERITCHAFVTHFSALTEYLEALADN